MRWNGMLYLMTTSTVSTDWTTRPTGAWQESHLLGFPESDPTCSHPGNVSNPVDAIVAFLLVCAARTMILKKRALSGDRCWLSFPFSVINYYVNNTFFYWSATYHWGWGALRHLWRQGSEKGPKSIVCFYQCRDPVLQVIEIVLMQVSLMDR